MMFCPSFIALPQGREPSPAPQPAAPLLEGEGGVDLESHSPALLGSYSKERATLSPTLCWGDTPRGQVPVTPVTVPGHTFLSHPQTKELGEGAQHEPLNIISLFSDPMTEAPIYRVRDSQNSWTLFLMPQFLKTLWQCQGFPSGSCESHLMRPSSVPDTRPPLLCLLRCHSPELAPAGPLLRALWLPVVALPRPEWQGGTPGEDRWWGGISGRHTWGTIREDCFHLSGPSPIQILEQRLVDASVLFFF